jgi:putative spermidine/putrescine transport system ATP-binding protein
VTALGVAVPVMNQGADVGPGPVDVLVRPEGLRMEVIENGNGIVTTRTFLGSVTRVGVLLSGDVTVQIDKASSEAAALAPGHVGPGGPAHRPRARRAEEVAALTRRAAA